jgi:hypothetical protein
LRAFETSGVEDGRMQFRQPGRDPAISFYKTMRGTNAQQDRCEIPLSPFEEDAIEKPKCVRNG